VLLAKSRLDDAAKTRISRLSERALSRCDKDTRLDSVELEPSQMPDTQRHRDGDDRNVDTDQESHQPDD